MRRPSYSLDRSNVVVVSEDWLTGMAVPNEQFVVVASRTQLLLIKGPLQSTDLLLMAH
jgi:hypothetical protein